MADADNNLSLLCPSMRETDKQIPKIAAYCSFKHILPYCTDVHDSSLVKQLHSMYYNRHFWANSIHSSKCIEKKRITFVLFLILLPDF